MQVALADLTAGLVGIGVFRAAAVVGTIGISVVICGVGDAAKSSFIGCTGRDSAANATPTTNTKLPTAGAKICARFMSIRVI